MARPGAGRPRTPCACVAALGCLLLGAQSLRAQAPATPGLRAIHACAGWLDEGVRLAGLDALDPASAALTAAVEACGSAAALRELAGLRLRQGRVDEAASLARASLARDPADRHTVRTLATALYLSGREAEALAAWNRVGTPSIEEVELRGVRRTDRDAVLGLLGLERGETLTPARLATARRRLSTLPVAERSRADYRPQARGWADVEVAVQERPVLFDDGGDLLRAGFRALVRRELAVKLAGPLGEGERWDARWRLSSQRPRWSVGVEAPLALGRGGVWRLEGGWRRETYLAAPVAADAAGGGTDAVPGDAAATSGAAAPLREERWHATLGYGRWETGAVRWEACTGWDRWTDRGDFLRAGAGAELRLADDRVAVGAEAAGWRSLEGRASFGSARVAAHGRTSAERDGLVLHGRLEAVTATADAPLGLWAGAGTGGGRPWLARAHPLTHGGIVDGALFGRRLVGGGVEAVSWLPADALPARLGFAAFADWATIAGRPAHESRPATHVDLGLGLRIAAPGGAGGFRLDVARGALDGRMAVSAGWETAWPGIF